MREVEPDDFWGWVNKKQSSFCLIAWNIMLRGLSCHVRSLATLKQPCCEEASLQVQAAYMLWRSGPQAFPTHVPDLWVNEYGDESCPEPQGHPQPWSHLPSWKSLQLEAPDSVEHTSSSVPSLNSRPTESTNIIKLLFEAIIIGVGYYDSN